MKSCVPTTVSKSGTNEEIVPARAVPYTDRATPNAVLLPTVPAYNMVRFLMCVTDAWKEYKVDMVKSKH